MIAKCAGGLLLLSTVYLMATMLALFGGYPYPFLFGFVFLAAIGGIAMIGGLFFLAFWLMDWMD